MILTDDDRVEALLRGESLERIREADHQNLRDALHILDAASTLADTLYAGRRTIRVITGRRRSYYVDTGTRYWIRFRVRRSGAEPITPGRFLREKVLAPDGITQEQLARALGVSRLTVNEIANDRRSVTAEMALRLEAVTRISAVTWLNLQRAVDLHRARADLADTLPRLGPITAKREFIDAPGEPEIDTTE